MKNTLFRGRFVLLLALVLLPFIGKGLGREVQITVDRNQISPGEEITLKVKVDGISGIEEIRIVNIDRFDVEGPQTSSHVQYINGKMSSYKEYTYFLYPKGEGDFKLGPAHLTGRDGAKYVSNSVSISINKGQKSKEREEKLDQYFYVESVVDNKTPYVNQQVIHTFRLYKRVNLTGGSLDYPEFKDFWKEELGKERRYRKVINGIEWHITEIKTALFANKAGSVTIPKITLNTSMIIGGGRDSLFDSFFGGSPFGRKKKVRLTAKPIELNVRPLPTENQPSDFHGLVGAFELKGELEKNNMKVGESTTLTLRIQGKGNLVDGKIVPGLGDRFKVYPDRPQLKNSIDPLTGIYGVKTFKYALVPQKEGQYSITPIKLTFFDPVGESYKTIRIGPFKVNVAPGNRSDQSINHVSGQVAKLGPSKENIKLNKEALLPIKSQETSSLKVKFPLVWIILLLGPLSYGIILIIGKRKSFEISHQAEIRKAKSYKKFLKDLQSLRPGPKFLTEAGDDLRQYLGDRLSIDGNSLTAADLDRYLKGKLQDDSTIEDFKDIFKAIDQGLYGGPGINEYQSLELIKKMKETANALERGLRE